MLNNTRYNDDVLLRRIAEGDEEAFRQLFHYYNKSLRPFVVKLTRSPQAAEEVLQEVFLKIWLHRARLTGLKDPRAYIIKIVSNESMNYLRALAKNNRLFDEIEHFPVVEATDPEQSIFYREAEQMVHEAVGQLPQACQKIYRMSREEYKRIPEIATELHLSDSTVKNQLVKALRVIRLRISHIMPLLLVFLFPY